jgi:hypothetical protein
MLRWFLSFLELEEASTDTLSLPLHHSLLDEPPAKPQRPDPRTFNLHSEASTSRSHRNTVEQAYDTDSTSHNDLQAARDRVRAQQRSTTAWRKPESPQYPGFLPETKPNRARAMTSQPRRNTQLAPAQRGRLSTQGAPTASAWWGNKLKQWGGTCVLYCAMVHGVTVAV